MELYIDLIKFRRAVAQRCHGPHMKGLVSIGAAHQGNWSTDILFVVSSFSYLKQNSDTWLLLFMFW